MGKSIHAFIFLGGLMVTSHAWAEKACFDVQGMTCATCGITVKSAVKKLKGVEEVKASVEKKKAIVQYDKTLTNPDEIKKAIDEVGYKATTQECKNIEG
ncbi:MAG: heavy-metal-associated domain-containing protein [Bdellovibrionales bacterium]